MKIRSDFITNSSSSAFVIIGAKFNAPPIDYKEMYDFADKAGLRYFSEENVIGKVIARISDESWTETSLTLAELQAAFEEVIDIFLENGISLEVKLITNMFST